MCGCTVAFHYLWLVRVHALLCCELQDRVHYDPPEVDGGHVLGLHVFDDEDGGVNAISLKADAW